MAGPSSSSAIVPQGGKYDVFISFRGTDTRENFISHLHAAFRGKNIVAFIDDRLRRGDEVSEALLRTIEESEVSVIVFSKNYASSRWCLDELVKILECRRRNGQIVVPVFYKVTPSDVRNQTGPFTEAFAKHERLSKQSLDSIQKWKDAMTEAANLSGWDSKVTRPEAEFIKKIVGDIYQTLYYISSSDFDGLIGINAHIQHIESLLRKVSVEGVRILGIWGMGGIGKSTLAGAFFNQNFAQFEGHYFLANVKEKSQNPEPYNLREKLLTNLLGDSNLSVNTPNLELDFIRRRLRKKKVLIVLDDVSDFRQIEFLVGGHDWFGPESIIILTSRDKQVLNSGGADMIYEVRGLDQSEALSLFRRHAFKQKKNEVVGDDHHHDDRELLSRATNYCEGNPLALKVLGSFLCGRGKQQQQSALDKLERNPNEDIQRVLRVSFDGLDRGGQDVFLHIACFFKGHSIREVTWLLDGCGFSTDIEIAVLEDKCLVFIQNETIQMHDLLQQMGWEIVHLECLDEPEKRSRLWDHNDICHVLTKNTGTEAVKAIFLHLPKTRSERLTSVAFERMYNLKLLKIKGKVHLHEGLEYLPNELRYLHWDGYPLPSLPSRFHPENLVTLRLRNNFAEQLWSGKQNLANLKVIDLYYSKNLISLPDLSLATNLESMDISWCESLIELPSSSVQHLHKLKSLDLIGCKSLGNLPRSICELESLEELCLFGCSSVTKFPEVPPSIKVLELGKNEIEEVPSSSIQFLTSLTKLRIPGCKRLKNLPSSICKLKSLECLDLVWCTNLESCPEIMEKMEHLREIYLGKTAIKELAESLACNLPYLEVLSLKGCNIQNIPTAINQLTRLQKLDLRGCKKLQSLPQLPMSVRSIVAHNCRSLEMVSAPFTSITAVDAAATAIEEGSIEFLTQSTCFRFTNCFKLDRNACKSIAEDAELRFKILSTILPGCPLQVEVDVCYPGSEVPNCFRHKITGSSITIKLPSWCNSRRFLGFALCAVACFKDYDNQDWNFGLGCYWTFKDKNGVVLNSEDDDSFAIDFGTIVDSDHVFLGYRELFTREAEYCEEISLEFRAVAAFQKWEVKKCGIHLLHDEERLNFSEEEEDDETAPKRLKSI